MRKKTGYWFMKSTYSWKIKRICSHKLPYTLENDLNQFQKFLLIVIEANTFTSQQEGSGLEPASRSGPFCVCVEYACSCRACVGFLPQSKDTQVRLIGNSKLPVGVNLSVNGCLILYVGCDVLWYAGDLSRVYRASRPVSAGIGSSLDRWTPNRVRNLQSLFCCNFRPHFP